MDYFNDLNWGGIWHVLKDIVLPHTGTLILYTLLFLFIGLLLSIFYIIFLSKKKILKRIPRYYNWAVKLYIPFLIIGFLYFFSHIGFITGVYKILKKEDAAIVSGIYDNALNLSFESEENKNEFITTLQESAIEFRGRSDAMTAYLKEVALEKNTGNSIIDKSKNKVTEFLIDRYGDDIYTIAMYGMLNLAGPHINLNESLSFEEFNAGMELLLEVGYKDIEEGIKEKLTIWYDNILLTQYKSFISPYLIFILIMMGIPLIEFFIYKKWVAPKYSDTTNTAIKS